jgi:hypothetical protein
MAKETQISKVTPRTVLEASFVNAVTKVFINEAAAVSIASVASVAPVCFLAEKIFSAHVRGLLCQLSLLFCSMRR